MQTQNELINRTLCRARSTRGQALVELALVLPILVSMLAGTAVVGIIAYASIEVTNAALAGVSYGAQNHTTASDSANIILAATQDASNISKISATTSISCTCSDGTAITCATAGTSCVSPARIIESVTVNTSAPITTGFNFPGIASTITLTGSATMRVEE